MTEPHHRGRLFEPYSTLTEYQRWMINLLVEDEPAPHDVEGALNGLLDEIEKRFARASEQDARISIGNAAVDLAPAIAHFPPLIRSSEARRRVNRWFSQAIGGAGSDGSDGPDEPIRELTPSRKKGRDLEL